MPAISLTTLGSAYTQNFDSLANTGTGILTTPNGWEFFESPGTAGYAAGDGSSNAGNTYSYGTGISTERAFGQLRSGASVTTLGASFTNNTGSAITSLAISYIGELWRVGTAARTDQMNFEYSLDATSLTTGTWTGVSALNFITPNTGSTGAKDGNAAGFRTSLSSTIASLSIANGITFWIRWTDTDASGADDGLAVDDFSLTPLFVPAPPTLNINDVSQVEGNGATTFTFTVSLTSPAGPGGVTFDIATADGTAQDDNPASEDNDYVAKSLTSQTIPEGQTSVTFTVTVNGDVVDEANETFFVNVTNVVGATAGDLQGQGTIVNDDSPPDLSINDVSVNEGSVGITTFTFTVALTAAAPAGGVTFQVAAANGTADASDYSLLGGANRFIAEGQTSTTITVHVFGDTDVEPSETFFLNISSVVGADVTDSQGLGTIVNDDFAGIVVINDVVVSEASGTAVVTLTRSGGLSPFSVDFATATDSAMSTQDFVNTAGTVNFAYGQNSATITIPLVDNMTWEGVESFDVGIFNGTNGVVIGDALAAVIIVDDEPIPLATLNVAYTENFDALSSLAGTTTNVMPLPGWFISEAGAGTGRDNELYGVSTGSDTSGDVYSYGLSGNSDRALGALASGSVVGTFGAAFMNETGVSLTSILVSFTAEQWRIGNSGLTDRLDFEISFDASSLATGTWTDVDALDVVTIAATPTGASNGNSLSSLVSFEIGNLLVSSGTSFWIRWTDIDNTGSDNGLAVDNFSITPKSTPGISIADVSHVEGDAGTVIYTFSVALDAPAGPGGVTFDIATADGDASATAGDYVARALTGQTIAAGSRFYTFDVTVNADLVGEFDEVFFVNLSNVVGTPVVDGQARGIIRNDDPLPIHLVQGPSHTSPFLNQVVETRGVVTARDHNGFWIQTPDAEVDADLRTSEGIFVFTGTAPPPEAAIGNLLLVTATVTEFVGGAGDLSVTELTGATLTILSTGNPLPAAILIGAGGRFVPDAIYDDDNYTSFDIATDGIDFYESLEGMRVTIDSPLVVSNTTSFGETFVVASNGAGATGINGRGGITISEGDMNPERIQIDADVDLFAGYSPNHSIGDTLASVTGILNYGFASYEVLVTQAVTVTGDVTLGLEQTALTGAQNVLTVASYNVENLDPNDAAAKFQQHALDIVQGIGSPDIIGLQEVQDADGAGGGADMSGAATAQKLINAIIAAGGPTYAYVEVAPAAGTTGGEPGGNIRNGYLYNPARVAYVPGSAELIDTSVYAGTRRPLVADFTFLGETVTIVDLHLTSRIGSDALFGATQPPLNAGDDSRLAQAQGVRDYLDDRFGTFGGDNIVVLGDLNSFYFEAPSNAIEAGGAYTNLYETLAPSERYSAVFEGNLQGLDNIIVSANLLAGVQFDPVHRNSEQLESAGRSDHDPVVAAIVINNIPVGETEGYKIFEDGNLVVTGPGVLANDSDADGQPLVAMLTATPQHGVLDYFAADGSFSYTPGANFSGTDTFAYRPYDGQSQGAIVWVTIVVQPVNDLPVSAGDSYSVAEDTLLGVGGPGVLANDGDVDGPALTVELVDGPDHAASFALNADGSFSYQAAADYEGPDSFTYRAFDGTGSGNVATVSLDVTAVDDPSVTVADSFATTEDAEIVYNVLANDSDVDGPALAVTEFNGQSGLVGALIVPVAGHYYRLQGNGNFTFGPNGTLNALTSAATGAANTSATFAFTYRSDSGNTAAIAVQVNGVRSTDDILMGSAGNDTITDGGFNYNDSFMLQQGGNDSASGLGGNDGFYFGAAMDQFDSVDGGAGTDSVAIQGNYAGLSLGNITNVENFVLLAGNVAGFGDTAGNFYDYSVTTNDVNVAAGAILSVVAGNLRAGEDLAFNGAAETNGAFRIIAGQGNDNLVGGAGNDGFFFGNQGNLTGADIVNGGGGIDSIALRGNYVGATALALTSGSMTSVETLVFLSAHTNEYGGAIDLAGFDYDVTMADANTAAGQTLVVFGSNLRANESLRFDGRAESDGSFSIRSGAGDDDLFGGAGNDLIYGNRGADRLEGGAGADTYLYRFFDESVAGSRDLIIWGAGDRIDLSLVDADLATAVDDAFTFIGGAAFTGVAGQLRVSALGADSFVEADVDGNGVADLVIMVRDWVPVAGDFVL